jgi:hypothetical protein
LEDAAALLNSENTKISVDIKKLVLELLWNARSKIGDSNLKIISKWWWLKNKLRISIVNQIEHE